MPANRNTSMLCVCGRSQKMPLCDNSHVAEGWSCAETSTHEIMGFCSSHRYRNLAHKLASHYSGSLILPGQEPPALECLVILADSLDLEFSVRAFQTVQARQKYVLSLGASPSMLTALFPDTPISRLESDDMTIAFKLACEFLDGSDATQTESSRLKSAFVSHAVVDESLLMPAVDYLRNYFSADLFLCADSIETGSVWQEEITGALESKDCFISLLSQASLASHFCSYEIGMASALQSHSC